MSESSPFEDPEIRRDRLVRALAATSVAPSIPRQPMMGAVPRGGGAVFPAFQLTPACKPPLPLGALRTNQNFVFLREIGGAECLRHYLDGFVDKGDLAGPLTTLIIDEPIVIDTPLVVPARLILRGCGFFTSGIFFENLPRGAAAITLAAPGFNGIRDLTVTTIKSPSNTGVLIEGNNTGPVILQGMRMEGWGYGIAGEDASDVLIDQIINVGIYGEPCIDPVLTQAAVRMGSGCRNWVIRDSHLRSCAWAVDVEPGARMFTIYTSRIESNWVGGVRFGGSGGLILGNYIEQNPNPQQNAGIEGDSECFDPPPPDDPYAHFRPINGQGVFITSQGRYARVLSNLFSGNDIFFEEVDPATILEAHGHAVAFNQLDTYGLYPINETRVARVHTNSQELVEATP